MTIIAKHILRNVKGNKLLSSLIICSVGMTTALLFVALSLSGVLAGAYENILRGRAGNADIVVHPGEMEEGYIDYDAEDDCLRGMTLVPEISALGMYREEKGTSFWFQVHALNWHDLPRVYPVSLDTEQAVFPNEAIVISKRTAQRLSLKRGDQVHISLNRQDILLTVAAVADNSGPFLAETGAATAFISLDAARKAFGGYPGANFLHVFLGAEQSKDSSLQALARIFPNYEVEEAVSERDIERQGGSFNTVFYLMFFVTSVMSVFIVYSSFKVIVATRLKALATFRSVGASKKMGNGLLFAEVMAYGMVGGLLGIAIGIPLLYFVARQLATATVGIFSLSFTNLLVSLAFAMGISFLAAAAPILALGKIPLKAVILGTPWVRVNKNSVRSVIGAILFGAGLLLPQLKELAYCPALVIASLPLVLSGIICLVPLLSRTLAKIFELLFPNSLVPRNMRKNSNFAGTITLLAIGMAVILTINTSNALMNEKTEETFALADYQLEVRGAATNTALLATIGAVPGVERVAGVYLEEDTPVSGLENMQTIYGLDQENFTAFFRYSLQQPVTQSFRRLAAGRNILVSQDYLLRSALTNGDEIELEVKGGKQKYKIVGVINEMLNTGNIAVIAETNFRGDFSAANYSYIAVKVGGEVEAVKEKIGLTLWQEPLTLISLAEMQQATRDINTTVYGILNVLTLLSSLVGTVGIVNNLVLDFLQRRRSLALLRSLGMDVRATKKSLILEGLLTGFIGSFLGFIGGFALTLTIPAVLRLFEFPMAAAGFKLSQFAAYLAAGIGISLLASLSIRRQVGRLCIVETIKVE